jgi:PAS domain S-box-containing protein
MSNVQTPALSATLAEEAIAAAEDAIITVDNHAQITSWNSGAQRMFGHSAAEAVGQGLTLIIPENHRPAHMAGFHEAMNTDHLSHDGQPAHIEGTLADGTVVPLVMSLGSLPPLDGVPVGVVAILQREDLPPLSFI